MSNAIFEPTKIKIKVLGDLNIPEKNIDKFNVRIDSGYLIIDNSHFMPFDKDHYADFCRRVGYTIVTDNFPENIDEKPDFSEESYISFAFNYKNKWLSFSDEISFYQFKIDELIKLRGL